MKGNLKVTTKTTLERNWLFFPERDLSNIDLTRSYINQHSKIIQMVETIHITIGQWSHIYIKISQRHMHEIYQRQDNHSITVVHLISGGAEEIMNSPSIQSIKR